MALELWVGSYAQNGSEKWVRRYHKNNYINGSIVPISA